MWLSNYLHTNGPKHTYLYIIHLYINAEHRRTEVKNCQVQMCAIQ